MAVTIDRVRTLTAESDHLAVVAVTRPDGSVHASLVNAGLLDDPVSGLPAIGIVVGGGSAKLGHLRRTRRATVVFHAGFNWVGVEGAVRLAGPDDPDSEVGQESIPGLLREVFIAAGGTHDDWGEYDRTMIAERRVAVFVEVDRIISNS